LKHPLNYIIIFGIDKKPDQHKQGKEMLRQEQHNPNPIKALNNMILVYDQHEIHNVAGTGNDQRGQEYNAAFKTR